MVWLVPDFLSRIVVVEMGDVMAICKLSEISNKSITRISCGIIELDRAIGKTDIGNSRFFGFPIGKISYLSGEHGVGKSRLSIQICKTLNKQGHKILYFQGEVPLPQFKEWFGHNPDNILCGNETDPSSIIDDINVVNPSFVVVDSVNMIDGFMTIAKDKNSFFTDLRRSLNEVQAHCLMLGQLNKDGSAKGPSDITHLVDIVCKLQFLKNADFIVNSGWKRDTKLKYLQTMSNQYGNCFVWDIGKNRYGCSGGWVMFRHNAADVQFLASKDIYESLKEAKKTKVPEKKVKKRIGSWWDR